MTGNKTVEAVTHFMFTELVDSLERKLQFNKINKGINTFISHRKKTDECYT